MVLRELCRQRGLSMRELGNVLGVSESTISLYETGKRYPNYEVLLKISEYFGVTVDYLLTGKEPDSTAGPEVPPGFMPLPKMDRVPRVGAIACGTPILAEENIEDYASIPSEWGADFVLMCQGDSMEPLIRDGDLVAIRRQPEVENGQLAAVLIGTEATLKRVYLHDDFIELRPENTAYQSIIRRREEMDDVRIEGKVVGYCRRVQ